jgi:hypothetical protein
MEFAPDGFLKKNNDGTTILHHICYQADLIHLKNIFEISNLHFSEFLRGDNKNNDPLHYAIASKNIDFIKYFIEEVSTILDSEEPDLGITDFISCYNDDSITPLYAAFMYKNIPLIKLLLEYGADIDEQVQNNDTPLHLAANLGNVEIVLHLLQEGAELTINDKGYTPLHNACISGNMEIVKLLVKEGVGLKIRNEEGHRAHDIAKMYGHHQIHDFLKNTLQSDFNLITAYEEDDDDEEDIMVADD